MLHRDGLEVKPRSILINNNMIQPISFVTCYYHLNIFLGISSLYVGLPSQLTHVSMGFSPIPFEVFHTFSLASPFVKGSTKFYSDRI